MIRRDVILLVALCAVVYATGLTVHGVTNWQEAQRLVVAREMQARGDWVVPTINGRPYLAKPPLISWCQLGLAELFGREVGLFELRLTVALAGIAGVVCTYFVARRLLIAGGAGPPGADPEVWGREAALWAGLMLATGVLYVRSSRIGELDILLVPFVVAGVGAIFESWRRARERRREAWGPILLAAGATIGAAMTKGPPGVLVIALAGFGGMALWAAFTGEPLNIRPFRRTDPAGDRPARAGSRWVDVGGGVLGFAGGAVAAGVNASGWSDAPGVVLLGVCGGVAGVVVARLLGRWERGAALFTIWSRTHPLIVVGVPLAVLWGWGRVVAARVGEAAAMGLVAEEAEDNLRLFVPDSPLVNLEAAAYGVGVGSAAAVAAAFWLWGERRERWGIGRWVVVAWVGLGLIAFSVLGKGVARYLTPVWPGIAVLGGMFVATWLRDAARPRAVRMGLSVVVLLLAVGQGWWYAYGREAWDGERSPGALVAEVLRPGVGIDPERLVTFEFRTPAVDYSAGRWVQHVGESGLRAGIAGGEAWTPEEFAGRVRESGEVWGVMLRKHARGGEAKPPVDRLAELGLVVQTVPAESRFVIDRGRGEVVVVRVWWPGGR